MKIFSHLKRFVIQRKIISLIILVILVTGGYLLYGLLTKTTTGTKYVLTRVEKGTIVSSLSSSGSVSALSQIDIKTKTSGDVVYIGAKAGQNVSSGQLLVQLDTTDAKKAIRTAEQNLQSAKISSEKFLGDASLAITRNKQEAQDTLSKNYESGFNYVANAFIDLPAIMVSLNNILYGNDFNNYQENMGYYTYSAYGYNDKSLLYKDSADKSYKTAKASYDKNFEDYKSSNRFSDNKTIDSLLSQTYNTSREIAQAVKDANNLIQFYKDTLSAHSIETNTRADTHLAELSSDLSKINSNLADLLTIQNTIKGDKNSLLDADLDTESQKLTLQKAEDALAEAKQNLSDYFVYAPFSGVLATMNAKLSDSAPSTVATIVSKTMTADISFGETDIAKIKNNQKATLTFDAIPDLTITGKVSQIDILGTSSQGVVSYNVKIVMDVQDDRIKPGMSITAVVITDTKTDALYVPNSAIKTQQGAKYVLRVTSETDTSPTKQTVETGVSDDASTEIISGLNDGDIVVSGTISTTTATKTSASNNSGVRIPGLTGNGPGR
jgi:RND family efflux transporter MFP subunit